MKKQDLCTLNNGIFRDFYTMIERSWTWARLTPAERTRCTDALRMVKLYGTRDNKIETLNAVYGAFLLALDYDSINWRKPDADAPSF